MADLEHLLCNLKNGTLLFILPVSSQLFPNIIIGDLAYNLFPMVEIPGGMIAIGLGDGSINIWSTLNSSLVLNISAYNSVSSPNGHSKGIITYYQMEIWFRLLQI